MVFLRRIGVMGVAIVIDSVCVVVVRTVVVVDVGIVVIGIVVVAASLLFPTVFSFCPLLVWAVYRLTEVSACSLASL